MTGAEDIKARIARLEKLLETQFGARQATLAKRAARVGRAVPRAVRRDLAVVAQAAQMLGHPRLALRIDTARVTAAASRAEAHLRRVDAADMRRGRLLGMLGALVFNLLLLGVIVLLVLRWRGLA